MRAFNALLMRGHPKAPVASFDASGGTIEAIKLTDNGVPKVLLRLEHDGVTCEMVLPFLHAADFDDEFQDALEWVANHYHGKEAR